jgi:outer membrane murein-binding lipoprotein Lpp
MRLPRYGLVALLLGATIVLGTACSSHPATTTSDAGTQELAAKVDALSAKIDQLDQAIVIDSDGFASFATPTPVPIVEYHDYGFGLPMPQNVKVTATGLSGNDATQESGSLLASASGTSVMLVWTNPSPPLSPQESVVGAFDVLQSLTQVSFEAQGAGQDLTVDSQPGAYGTFVSRDAAGAVDGVGIIGGWVCPNDQRSYAMTVTGKTLDAVQQSFVYLSNGFQCEAGSPAMASSAGTVAQQ